MTQVSIIVPIYNIPEEYLEKCFFSIQSQTWRDFECIFVDDGSTNNARNICDIYTKEDERFKYVYQTNQGVSSARNLGIKRAVGKWIMFVDPDDYLEENIVEKLLLSTDEKCDIVICSCSVLVDEKKEKCSFFGSDQCFETEKTLLFAQLMDQKIGQNTALIYTAIGVPWAKLYRKSFLNNYNLLFDCELRRMQDNIFNMYAFHFARKINYINERLYVYRYEHIMKFKEKYDANFCDTYLTILKKRQICVNEIGIITDSYLNTLFLRECFLRIKTIFRYGPFHKNHRVSFMKKMKYAHDVRSKEIVETILKMIGNQNAISGIKDKIMYFLIKYEIWILLMLVWRFI